MHRTSSQPFHASQPVTAMIQPQNSLFRPLCGSWASSGALPWPSPGPVSPTEMFLPCFKLDALGKQVQSLLFPLIYTWSSLEISWPAETPPKKKPQSPRKPQQCWTKPPLHDWQWDGVECKQVKKISGVDKLLSPPVAPRKHKHHFRAVWRPLSGCSIPCPELVSPREVIHSPVRWGGTPGEIVSGSRSWARYYGLLHSGHVPWVGFEQRGILAGQHRSLIPAKLGSPVLEPHLGWEAHRHTSHHNQLCCDTHSFTIPPLPCWARQDSVKACCFGMPVAGNYNGKTILMSALIKTLHKELAPWGYCGTRSVLCYRQQGLRVL